MSNDLLPEYTFDYSQAQPNRFAGRAATVVLRPDVLKRLQARANAQGLALDKMVNDMLREDIKRIDAASQ